MIEDKNRFWRNVIIAFGLVAVLWIVHLIQVQGNFDPLQFGNIPRNVSGLKGIIFSPFIHGNMEHLVSNTLPILVLLSVLLNAYPRVAFAVLIFVHLSTGILVWLLAPGTGVHIGISGIIYGIASFLIASGVFRKNTTSMAIAIFVTLVYGSMVLGFIPLEGVSWQSHLYGALSGIVIAFVFRKVDLPPPTEIDLEEVEPDKHFFDE